MRSFVAVLLCRLLPPTSRFLVWDALTTKVLALGRTLIQKRQVCLLNCTVFQQGLMLCIDDQ